MEERIEKEIADIIATALYNQELVGLDDTTLDELAFLRYFNDPDVEFEDLEYTEEAGVSGHGVNTEAEMNYTWGDF